MPIPAINTGMLQLAFVKDGGAFKRRKTNPADAGARAKTSIPIEAIQGRFSAERDRCDRRVAGGRSAADGRSDQALADPRVPSVHGLQAPAGVTACPDARAQAIPSPVNGST